MWRVSKEIFLNALACPTLAWLKRQGQIKKRPPTVAERFRLEQGLEIGRRARELYPDGHLVEETDLPAACNRAVRLINNSNVSVIFEAAFLVGDCVARADILRREGRGWRMIEVKSSVNDKEEFIDDMAYTVMVSSQSGLDISGVSLMLISRDFRLGMKPENLFLEIDHTNEVLDRVDTLGMHRECVETMTRDSEKPEPTPTYECRGCELFKECVARDIDNHVFEIPRLGKAKFDKLADMQVFRIRDMPDGFPLTENQRRVTDCVKTGNPFLGDGLKQELEAISWPAFYLDFETTMTAVPLYPDIAPYTQIPTQYSIHKCSSLGVISDHFEYLADPSRDCRRELADNLLHTLEGAGAIIAYSHFEKSVLNGLKELCTDLSEALDSAADRIIDLMAIIKRNIYHPDFHGSVSLKSTLPVLVPKMSYEKLDIADGGSAMAVFALLALGKFQPTEAETRRKALLEYCEQDTLAMVRLHERLAQLV